MNIIQSTLPNPRGTSPLRRAGSIRRTSSMDVTWPAEREGEMHLTGRARDIITPASGGSPDTIHLDELFLTVDANKNIQSIRTNPERKNLQQLIGTNGFSGLRQNLDHLLLDDKNQAAPLYQLMNDITGCLVVSDWAWASRKESLLPEARAKRIAMMANMEGVCTGFSPDSSALRTDGAYQASMAARVVPLPHPEDSEGWHELKEHGSRVSLRRARRMDVWLDEDIVVESTFQDSATTEAGDRIAVHEYSVEASFDSNLLTLKSIQATPHILPFVECPGAIKNLQQLIGTHAQDLRAEVSKRLRKVNGCTHLNDATRALAEAPTLINLLVS